jgi:hypothetical protein
MSSAPDSADSYLRAFVNDPPPSIHFEEGLSPAEIDGVEQRFGFAFPPDLRDFLTLGLPVSERFPNWRAGPDDDLADRLGWPADGICFDIEHNAFWYDAWGPRPDDVEEACALARSYMDRAPKLVPIYSHRYIPAEPARAGNPILSVYQADIICYGENLPDYLAREFGEGRSLPATDRAGSIPFWGDILRGRYQGGWGL